MFPGETVLSQGDDGLKDPHHGEFKVMQSHGNRMFYIGSMFLSCGDPACGRCGVDEYPHRHPAKKGTELDYNSRETDYFKSEQAAKDALEVYKKTGEMPMQRY